MEKFRLEKDFLGEREVPENALWGIHTERARENFKISSRRVPQRLIHAYGEVKLACARVNQRLGYLEERRGNAIQAAAAEVTAGQWDEEIVVDAYQGGAGTSTNMNINEVIANRALQIMGKKPGDYSHCDPLEHVNLHQSTNDTYPTALRVAVFKALKELEKEVTQLQEATQEKEQEFSHILKIGRTELMDAIPMTLGRTFGAWAEALTRDRWRIFKCTERIRVINLGGTAIGTGLGAPRKYIFQVGEELRIITGLPLARAENLLEATQNQDILVEVMGMIKTHAMNLMKISGDLRLLNMGPDTGIGEVRLPALQAGSSIMPNKVNPVIPEMLTQVAIQVFGFDQAITWAAGSGQLELNAFLPLIALNMLESLNLLQAADRLAAEKCLRQIQADEKQCQENACRSRAQATVLVPLIGYHQAAEVAKLMQEKQLPFEQATHQIAGLTREECQALLAPCAVNALGFIEKKQGSETQ
ncbi:aspartate ammonia-lyase [bacterium]|nr:aspartate ammonia-lyase [bacterium]